MTIWGYNLTIECGNYNWEFYSNICSNDWFTTFTFWFYNKRKKKQAQLKDEVWKYGEEEEDTIDYVLFRIRELTGRLV